MSGGVTIRNLDRAQLERLVNSLVDAVGPGPVSLDMPAPNPSAVELPRDFGLHPTFKPARMYRGPAPPLELSRVFGVTSSELG